MSIRPLLPEWAHPWIETITLGAQIVLIVLVAWVLNLLLRRVMRRIVQHYGLPREVLTGVRRITGFVIYTAALLLVLDRFGVSGTVIWTAITGFTAVAAVAFFAAWSVLSNIFCSLLILTSRPFRLYDHIEVLENGDKPGLKGRVVDISFIHTTLQERLPDGSDTVLQIPNSLFFQRVVRRWRDAPQHEGTVEDETAG